MALKLIPLKILIKFIIIIKNMKIGLLLMVLYVARGQIPLMTSKPSPQTQFGSIFLNNLTFQVVPSQPQEDNTGFSTGQQNQGSRLIHLPIVNSFFPSPDVDSFYQLFGLPRHAPSIIELSFINRTYDGTGNNNVFPLWGSAHIPLIRFSPYDYEDGIQKPRFKHLNPRQISNEIGKIKLPIKRSKDKITMLFVFWGQFIDHDISLTEAGEQYMPIKIPQCDEFMDTQCRGIYEIPFNRSIHEYATEQSPRQQINLLTAWIDGSQIYGSDEETMRRLRKFQNGHMILDQEQFLPRVKENRFNLFDAGDIRANQNVILTSLHTIFVRQHNRLAEEIKQINQFMTDQQLFQGARHYVIGLVQKITFQDFLPLMIGPKAYQELIGQYKGYNASINPNVANQFSTAAFRIGHSLIVNKFPLINQYDEVEEEKRLHELFFNPDFLNKDSMEKILRGVCQTLKKQKSPEIIDQLRNLLIPGAQDKITNLDLFSLNLQRNYDHGLPNYNQIRVAYGLQPVSEFSQIIDDPQVIAKLEKVYFSPYNLDTWVGIISQRSLQGAVLGQLGAKIVADQFGRIRNGDSFWYQEDYPFSIIDEIKNTEFSDIIMRNTALVGLQQNVFKHEK